jgi:hypothetical protein
MNSYGVLLTGIKADAAFNTFRLIDDMWCFFFSADGPDTAFMRAEPASVAEVMINFQVEQRLTNAGITFAIDDVSVKLVSEIFQGRLHRIRCRLAEAAQSAFLHGLTEFLQQIDMFRFAPAFTYFLEDTQHLMCAESARETFAAGFGLSECEKIAGHIDHAGILIHDHHSSGPHNGAGFRQ